MDLRKYGTWARIYALKMRGGGGDFLQLTRGLLSACKCRGMYRVFAVDHIV